MSHAPSLRSRIAAAAAALGLLVAVGCGGKNESSPAAEVKVATIKGDVTYVRVPLTKDSNGVPTGLETNPANYLTLPARGVGVRAYQLDPTTSRWRVKQVVYTDSKGHYAMLVPAGENYAIQVESFTQPFLGSVVTVIADPNGLSSTLPQAQRARYFLRAAPDGTLATSATPLPASTVIANSTYTLNFTTDLSTSWLTGPSELISDGTDPDFTSATFESSPTGSRVLAILDSVYAFSTTYGNPTPGAPLDLHYLMGHSEPEGTFIQYDVRHWVQPGPGGIDLAYDPDQGTDHYFGSIRGAAANDDAWDESVLYTLMGRANLMRELAAGTAATYPYALGPIVSPIDGLSPDLAMAEGFPFAMAANLLKSPYLADTDGTSALLSTTDIRDYSAVPPSEVGPHSPLSLASLMWDLGLKANGITAPGTVTNWATIDPLALKRVFTLALPASGSFYPANIYGQLALLKNAKSGSEPVDLAAIFNDTTINTISSPYNLPWPQPTSTTFGQTWTSTTGGTYVYNGTLSMASDHQVSGTYANASYQEIAYLGVSQANDQAYQMTLQTTPNPLPAGATIEVVVFAGGNTQAYTFAGNSASPIAFTLAGNGSTTSPNQYPIRVRLISPSTLQPDIPFTLQLAPAPPGTLRGPVLGR
ncbi:MAG: hypothetical protein JST24_01100 [Acidobacteria bacterium]|nr:hypothetical protein [Acidobacteriota bacterium]